MVSSPPAYHSGGSSFLLVSPAIWRFPTPVHSLDQFAQEKLDDLQRRHLRRALAETVREDGIWVERAGRRLLSFSCNDYLNLTQHPAIKQAAIAAIERYGAGSGASRLVTGNHPLFAELETRLARIKQTEAACVFGSGYLANAGIIPVLIGGDGLVLADELSHACLFAGAQLSRGTVRTFRHNDCLLYTSDAADDLTRVDLGGRRIIKK